MAGATVLEWTALDSEIKTAGLKDVSGCYYLAITHDLIFSDRIHLLLRTCTIFLLSRRRLG
jgi:hypothetical protein